MMATFDSFERDRMILAEPLFTFVGLAMLALCGPTLLMMYVDTRTIQGANVWIEPLKFQMSVGLFLLTLAYFARYLPEGMTGRPDYRVYAALVVLCAVAEIIWICGAAAFATASHFSTGPLMSAIYGLMGVAAVVLTSATLVYGVAMLKSGPMEPLVTSVAVSLILTFILTVTVAFRLASNESHFVGEATFGQSLPLLGWSMEVGDLRVPHFFATHAMQIIPALALAVYATAPTLHTTTTVVMISFGYTAFTMVTFLQALNGRPFIS